MWWKFALTLLLFAAFVGAIAATTPRSIRSLQVFVAALSFVCGLATAMVWMVQEFALRSNSATLLLLRAATPPARKQRWLISKRSGYAEGRRQSSRRDQFDFATLGCQLGAKILSLS